MLLEIGKCRNQLANHPRGEHGPTQRRETFRQPLSRNVVGDERQIILRREHFHRSDFGERFVSKLRKQVYALAQRVFKISGRDDSPRESQELERWPARVVEHQEPIADWVGEALRVPTGVSLLM